MDDRSAHAAVVHDAQYAVYCCWPPRLAQLPFVDQCHASLGRFEKPKRAALAESHTKAGELVVIVEPFSVKSMASPISCMDVPGMAVGTRQELAGAL